MSFDCSSKRDYFVLFTFWLSLCRSSRPKVFCKKGALRNFTKFTWKRLCRSLFLNKIAGLRPATLFKNRLWHRCFFCDFCEVSNNTFSYRTPLVAVSICVHPSRSNDNTKKWWFGHNLNFLHKKMIRHKLLVCNSKWNVFLKIFYSPSV